MGDLVVYVSISKTSLDLCERLDTGRKVEDINAAGYNLDVIKVPAKPSAETLKTLETLKITRLPALFEPRTRETFIGIGDILRRVEKLTNGRRPAARPTGDLGVGGELGAWQAREMYNTRGGELVPRDDDEADETRAFERDIDRKKRRYDAPQHRRAPREQEAREPPRARPRRRSPSPEDRSRSNSPRDRSESPPPRRERAPVRRDNIDDEDDDRPRGRARRGGGGGSGEDQMDDRMLKAFLENNDETH